MVAYDGYPSIQKLEAGRLWIQSQSVLLEEPEVSLGYRKKKKKHNFSYLKKKFFKLKRSIGFPSPLLDSKPLYNSPSFRTPYSRPASLSWIQLFSLNFLARLYCLAILSLQILVCLLSNVPFQVVSFASLNGNYTHFPKTSSKKNRSWRWKKQTCQKRKK